MTTIRILHLSDLHFGAYNRFADRDPRNLGKACCSALAEARRQLDDQGAIDLVVVSGDIAERGRPREFRDGRAFLEMVCAEFGISKQRFVFVPGNHDISRPDCLKVEADQQIEEFDENELSKRIGAVKLKHYDEFISSFYGADDPRRLPTTMELEPGGWLFSFPDLRLSVGSLSSCEKETHRHHVGSVSERQAKSLLDAWSVGESRDWLKIMVVHHNPELTTSNNLEAWREKLKLEGITEAEVVDSYISDICGMEGSDHLKQVFAQCQVQLLLHGHQHAGDKKIWPWKGPGQGYVLSAGSFSLVSENLPKGEPLSFQFIRLDLIKQMLDARRLIFTEGAETPGEVKKGGFTLDPAERDGYQNRLELPAAFSNYPNQASVQPALDTPQRLRELPEFLRIFRQRMSGAYSSWTLSGGAQGVAGGRLLEGQLDEMYVELRFATESNLPQTERGWPIGISEIRKLKESILVRGSAGTGKTTWIHRTFQRLITDGGFVPLMLVLSDLSRRWKNGGTEGQARSLDFFLDDWVGEHLGPKGTGWAGRVLRLSEGPRPVLLIDGWDEVGELGGEVRFKLVGLMREFPRVLVIATSRPYGKDKPRHSDGFASLEVQPLSDNEMGELSRRFFRLCHVGNEAVARRELEKFEIALAASAEARSLGRTPFFLTMMLMIGRNTSLPGKRHLLYENCVESLLQALPEKRASVGVEILDHQWRPEDSRERRQVVAKLAFEMQKQGYQQEDGRGAVVRQAEELVPLLPAAWSERDKGRFFSWLTGPAGLLSDRTDGTYHFSHLSFQEYLTAWYLDTSHAAAGRSEVFAELGKAAGWWETLQLWSALIDRRNSQDLDVVLSTLFKVDWDGVSFSGMILADGSASPAAFRSWGREVGLLLADNWLREADRCLRAWRATTRWDRKEELGRILQNADDWSWLPWYRASLFCEAAGQAPPDFPVRKLVSRAGLEQAVEGNCTWSAAHIAASRLYLTRNPVWPLEPAFIGLLHLWPNRRRWLGCRLQALAATSQATDLLKIGTKLRITEERRSGTREHIARDFARCLASDFGLDFGVDFARYLAYYFEPSYASKYARAIAHEFARDHTRNFSREMSFDTNSRLSLDSDINFSPYLGFEVALEFAHRFARDFAIEYEIDLETTGLLDFSRVEVLALGRAGARYALAELGSECKIDILRLFRQSANLSFRSYYSSSVAFQEDLVAIGPSLHPIWPALAKHIARCSTPDDCALLRHYAEHPMEIGEPLCWGLQFIVRGDVMREDGSIITLDELSETAGLGPLPLLEEMPLPELAP